MKLTFLGTSHGDPTPGRFCSAILLECGTAGYLFDCGAPVTSLLVRRGFDFSRLSHIFISHMHLDHWGDLLFLLKHKAKHQQDIHCFLPEEQAEKAVHDLLCLAYPPAKNAPVFYNTVSEGVIFKDSNLEIRAVATKHFKRSFAYLICGENKKILYTGDLKADISDFPVHAAQEADLCISELTHAACSCFEEKLQSLPLKQMIFTHIGPRYEKEGVLTLPELPFPVTAAYDGMEYSV